MDVTARLPGPRAEHDHVNLVRVQKRVLVFAIYGQYAYNEVDYSAHDLPT